jgi:hypothetical protein
MTAIEGNTCTIKKTITTNGPVYGLAEATVGPGTNGGQSFTLVYSQHSYDSLTASPQQPQIVYGKSGLQVYRSTDGGKTWNPLPTIKGNLYELVADPSNPNQVYLALSYPVEMYHFQATNSVWKSLTPAV